MLCSAPLCRRPVPARGGGLGEVQRGHEWLLHGPLRGRRVELHHQSAAAQSHSPDQQRPSQPHPQHLPASQVCLNGQGAEHRTGCRGATNIFKVVEEDTIMACYQICA